MWKESMQYTPSEYAEIVLDLCSKNTHFANEVSVKKSEVAGETAERIREGFRGMPGRNRVLSVDMKETPDFVSFLQAILVQVFQDPKFSSEDTMVLPEDIEDADPMNLKYQAECIFQIDFAETGVHCLILIENFEATGNRWTPTDCGWFRGLLCTSSGLSIAVCTGKSIYDVTKGEPVGSSPLANIFTKVTIGE